MFSKCRKLLLLLTVFSVQTAFAQRKPLVVEIGSEHKQEEQHVCATIRLLAGPDGQRAMANWQNPAKRSRDLRVPPETYSIGDSAWFNVRQDVLKPVSEQEWEAQRFVLKAEGMVPGMPEVGYRIWLEREEAALGHVQQWQIAELENVLVAATPEGSFDPSKGAIANDIDVFGELPDIDGDGVFDILLTDIVEGVSTGTIVAGFFDPNDQTLSANPTKSNFADVLYLDTDPTIRGKDELSSVLKTAAHEIQHLIHWNYDPNESLFVNEGLSEWAQVLNGLGIRNPNYLLQGGDATNVPLVAWDTEALLREYQRAGLWTSYLADQFGPYATGAITRSRDVGSSGYRTVLSSYGIPAPLEDIVFDFHTANWINDPVVDDRFAHFAEPHLDVTVTPEQTFSGSTSTEMEEETISLEPGGVVYYEWRSVRDLKLNVAVASSQIDWAQVRVFTYLQGNSQPEWEDLDLRNTEHIFSGSFDRVRVVASRTNLLSGSTQMLLSASWGSTAVSRLEVGYGQGDWGEIVLNVGANHSAAYATGFDVPDEDGEVSLSRVWLPNYYMNQFVEGMSSDEVRDFQLLVLDDQNGMPGAEILRVPMVDERPFESPDFSLPIASLEIDLSEYSIQLSDLPERIYVGAQNKLTGRDSNYVVVPISFYDEENVSFHRQPSGWVRFWDVETTSIGFLIEYMAPVRVEFTIDGRQVATEPAGIPAGDDLWLSNYPNPFSSGTALQYVVPESGEIRIEVFDMTGRRIAVPVEGNQPAGSYSLGLDATGWAPGQYACVISTDAKRHVHLMTIIR